MVSMFWFLELPLFVRCPVRSFCLILMACVIGACTSDTREAETVVRDSAQVTIVETRVTDEDSLIGWTIEDQPVLDIGSRDGPEEYQFGRIVSAWRSNAGRVLVADGMAGNLRVFDMNGEFLFEFGQTGNGPGEFRALTGAEPYRADSILAWDAGARRVNIFDVEGELARSFSISFPEVEQQGTGPHSFRMDSDFLGSLADGSVLFASPVFVWTEPGERTEFDVELLRYSNKGELFGSIGRFPRGEWITPRPERPAVSPPFPRAFSVAVGGTEVLVAASEDYEILMLSPEGVPGRLVRLSGMDLAIRAEDREAALLDRRSRLADRYPPAELERALNELPFPATHPPYTELRVDEEGYLWVKDPEALGENGSTRWRIFDASGMYLGIMEVSREWDIHQVGRDCVLAVATDDFDVPLVQIHQLSRE